MIDASTPFRSIGDLPRSVWERVLGDANSPLLGYLDVILRQASPHGALALAQAYKESRLGKEQNALATNNPLGLMVRGSSPSRLQRFNNWAAAFREFNERISLVDAPYTPADLSLEGYLVIYVGGPDCWDSRGRNCANGEQWVPGAVGSDSSINLYIDQTIERINSWMGGATPVGVPYPELLDYHVVKPYEGAGFTRCAPRADRIFGVCDHITEGDPGGDELAWYRDFFSTGGERATDALVDVVFARDGRIGLLNNWRDPLWGGRRAGYANGGVDGLEGDGLAFYRAFPAINEHLVSKEHVAGPDQPITDPQIESSARLDAAIAYEWGVHWSQYPIDERYGVSFVQSHNNFATKPCPRRRFLDVLPEITATTKELLRLAQPGQTPPMPEPPVQYTELGFSLGDIEGFFGTIRRENPNGTVDELPFDPVGPVSLLWLRRCEEERKFPQAKRLWYSDAGFIEGREAYASFEGGWIAFLPLTDSRASWQWLDKMEG